MLYGKYRDSDSRGPKGRRPTPGKTLIYQMKIGDELREIIEYERRKGERQNDTVLRLLGEKGQRIGELQKKVDALSQELQIKYAEVPNK